MAPSSGHGMSVGRFCIMLPIWITIPVIPVPLVSFSFNTNNGSDENEMVKDWPGGRLM